MDIFFTFTCMHAKSFKNFETDEEDENVQWMKIKSLRVTRDEPDLFIKTLFFF